MTIEELAERIAQWENLHTEFKEGRVDNEKLASLLVCFANTDGGQLIFGVRDNRAIVGVQEDLDKFTQHTDSIASNNCEPPITVIQEILHAQNGEAVVIVNIPKGDMRPYRTKSGRYRIRTSSGCRDASREELLRLFQATQSLYYDESPLLRLGVGDLDLNAVDRYLEQNSLSPDVEATRLLENWGLMSDGHPTVGGLVLFGREPQRHLPHAQINAARFPGTDASAAPTDRKDLGGQLFDIVDEAQRFLKLHLTSSHDIRGFEPERHPEIPEVALREAVVNAVAHRDYTVQGPVRLFVFDDRVEVHTPGRAPNTVTAEGMRYGVHVVRNPRIYVRLFEAGYVTGAGTGVPRMVKTVKDETGQEVQLTLRADEVLVSIPRTV